MIAPPVAGMDDPLPSAKAATAFKTETGTEELLVDAGSVMETCAATPLEIVVAFTPKARHVRDPLEGLH